MPPSSRPTLHVLVLPTTRKTWRMFLALCTFCRVPFGDASPKHDSVVVLRSNANGRRAGAYLGAAREAVTWRFRIDGFEHIELFVVGRR
jgi:hypothetical protein